MADYIDKMAAIKAINKYCEEQQLVCGELWAGLQTAKNIILDQPAADVVEVVRCKECKHCCPSAFGGFACFGRRIPSVLDDDYCNYGERREED